MANDDTLDDFILKHEMIQDEIDSKGFKGLCATSEGIKERVNISDDGLKLHYKLFDVDEYRAQPAENVSCSRDAIRLLAKRLATAME